MLSLFFCRAPPNKVVGVFASILFTAAKHCPKVVIGDARSCGELRDGATGEKYRRDRRGERDLLSGRKRDSDGPDRRRTRFYDLNFPGRSPDRLNSFWRPSFHGAAALFLTADNRRTTITGKSIANRQLRGANFPSDEGMRGSIRSYAVTRNNVFRPDRNLGVRLQVAGIFSLARWHEECRGETLSERKGPHTFDLQ